MRKLFIGIGIAIAGILGIFILGAVVLTTLVNPNDYKQHIASLVHSQTGYSVEFTGDIHLSFFPWLGLTVDGLRVANPPNFTGDLAKLAGADLHVRLLPLLKGEVQISAVRIEGLHLELVRDATGRENWAGSGTPSAPPTQSAPAQQDSASSNSGLISAPLASLLVDSVSLQNATVSFADQTTGRQFRAQDIIFTTSTIHAEKPVDVAFSAHLDSNAPELTGDLRIGVTLQIAPGLASIALDNLWLELDAEGAALPGAAVRLRQQGAMQYWPSTQRLDLTEFSLSAYENTLVVNGAAQLGISPGFDGKISLRSKPAAALRALGMPIQTPDAGALATADLKARLLLTPRKLLIEDLSGALDSTAFSGEAELQAGKHPQLNATIAVTDLNLDRYLPLAGEASTPADTPQTGAVPPVNDAVRAKDAARRSVLRASTLHATFSMRSLTVRGIALTDITATATGKDGLFRVKPLSAKLSGGTITASLFSELQATNTHSGATLDLAGLYVGPLVKTLTGKTHADGTASFMADVTAKGESWQEISRTLNGNGSALITDGAVYGFQIIPEAARTQLSKSRLAKADAAVRKQPFERVSATYTIRNGLISSKDITLASPHLGVAGEADVNLPQNTIRGKGVVRISGLPDVPVVISGTLSSPSYGFDAKSFLRGTVKGLENLIPFPAGNQSGANQSTDKPAANPLKQLEKGLKNLFK